jgi:hypothetical protein
VSAKLTFDFIKERVAGRLGSACRTVEISDDNWRDSIEQAIDLWNQYESLVKYFKQTGIVTSEQQPFYIQLADDSTFKGVRTVYFLVPYWAVTGGYTIFELLEKMTLTRMNVGGLALARSTWEMYRRVRGVDPTWHYDKASNRLYLYAPSGPFDAGYELLYAYTESTEIPQGRDYLFLKAVEGFTRMILGEIRGKFGGQVLAPGGGSFQLDADYQRNRGKELIDMVTERLNVGRTSAPVPFRA